MIENFRRFEAGPDPFERTWLVEFRWLQNAISIRHSDSIDVKFHITTGDESYDRVISLMHTDLLALSRKTGRPITDPWVTRLAALHLKRVLKTGEDLEKTLITPSLADLEEHSAHLVGVTPAMGDATGRRA
ncbi:MAG: hypothetical protein HUU41_17880 [Bryobacteraceae bacterium]|nr:hypothetical protein [Bryobacterales bacterium]MEB2360505.1 hypothetical protein [Bryobacterales bacterium]NUN02985.1 hypothetical protein [Bryobacteraceae bacterium]